MQTVYDWIRRPALGAAILLVLGLCSIRGLGAAESYAGSLNELGKVHKVEDVKVLTRRAFEVVEALRSLLRAYTNYFGSVNDSNRAQFRLYWALGYPAGILECERPTGPLLPVDAARPPQMAPVCPSDPCPGRR